MATKRITISYDDIDDADLITWLEQQDNRSEYIRDLIRRDRDARGHSLPTAALDEQRFRQILREELATVTLAPLNGAGEAPEPEEDPELVARLNEMF